MFFLTFALFRLIGGGPPMFLVVGSVVFQVVVFVVSYRGVLVQS